MSEKCDICGAMAADQECSKCKKKVCSSCIDENGLLCKNCGMKYDEKEGIEIGFAPLQKMVNLPLFAVGIAILITGIAIMTWASVTIPINFEQMPQQQQPRGFVYIFPFPFVFGWGSLDVAVILPVIIAVIALPIIVIVLMFRNFARFQ